jgi:hypothetical protein
MLQTEDRGVETEDNIYSSTTCPSDLIPTNWYHFLVSYTSQQCHENMDQLIYLMMKIEPSEINYFLNPAS